MCERRGDVCTMYILLNNEFIVTHVTGQEAMWGPDSISCALLHHDGASQISCAQACQGGSLSGQGNY